jgi:hypothetical protein
MEKWNGGIMEKQLKLSNPIFHSSNIPIFHLNPLGG